MNITPQITINPTCASCRHRDIHGGWGHEGTHCPKCHRSWKSTRAAHCPICCRHFSSDSACEDHKRYPEDQELPATCVDPGQIMDEMGRHMMHLDERDVWSRVRPQDRGPGSIPMIA